MFKKDNFFKSYFINSIKYRENLKKTKFFFSSLLVELKNNQIPMLTSYDKNFEFDFSKSLINKFSKYKNIIIIGMGGSILGTKCIYSFFKNKIKKKVFFFDNLDLDLISKYKKIKNLNNSCFIVVTIYFADIYPNNNKFKCYFFQKNNAKKIDYHYRNKRQRFNEFC